ADQPPEGADEPPTAQGRLAGRGHAELLRPAASRREMTRATPLARCAALFSARPMHPPGPVHLPSPSGLAFPVNANASIRRIDHRDVLVNAYLGNELEGGPANLFLRRRGERIAWIPLLGPGSPGAVELDASGLEVSGEWSGVRFRASLRLAETAPA